jgi:S-adenosylmethionine:tRNA ribosyltransferase-isomerase
MSSSRVKDADDDSQAPIWDIAAYDFALPEDLIADRPARPRDTARLLDVDRKLADLRILDLPDLLRPADVMVFNDTRVLPARLVGHRRDARVEVTLHMDEGEGLWRAFARPARKLRAGDRISFGPDFAADVIAKRGGGEVTLRFAGDRETVRAGLGRYGAMPLPPYIKRAADDRDRRDYQTIYSEREGAVAAPTAGLHFTDRLLAALERRGIKRVKITLHVGAGTFLPVKVDDIRDHKMYEERGVISDAAASAINECRIAGGRIVAVGTTSLRLLESAADEAGRIRPFDSRTDIFIYPGHRFRTAELLLTNFHLPRSTLFMLVAAFAGLERMRAAYAHAIAQRYRFYSYGDACLLHREDR